MSWIISDTNYPMQESWDLTITFPSEPLFRGLFFTLEDYPMFESYKPDKVPTEPNPVGIFVTDEDYPKFPSWELSSVPKNPLPEGIFVTRNDYPKFITWELPTLGAFNGASVETCKIPSTLETVGRYSFKDTSLVNISLPEYCTYYVTSFPKTCFVQGGTLIND